MSAPAQPLRILDEHALFGPPVGLAELRAPVAAPGAQALLQAAGPGDPAAALAFVQAHTDGRVRPEVQPVWMTTPVHVRRVAGAVYLPRYGALVWPDGSAPRTPLGGALTDEDRLAEAPGFSRSEAGLAFAAPEDAPEIASGGVFMPWGGGFNYGHFLLDALPSLLALEEAGLLEAAPPLAPPLKPWQRELIALLGVAGPAVRELKPPAVRLAQAAYATSLDHYLHAPNALMLRMRARLAARAPAPPMRAERVYLSRRSHAHPMRILLNEAELERALAARGFAIVRPERLRPGEQVALARQARVIVGATGAGMANALFADAGALVVDIQPQVFPGAWVMAFGRLVGHDSWIYSAPAPAPEQDVPWARRVRRGFRFGYHLPLEDFLAFLDARLHSPA